MTKLKTLLVLALAIALAAPLGIAQVKKLKPLKPKADAGVNAPEEKQPDESAKRLEALRKQLRDLAQEQKRLQRELERLQRGQLGDPGRLPDPGAAPRSRVQPWRQPFDFNGRFRGLEDLLKGLDDQFKDFDKRFRDRWPTPAPGVHGSDTSISVRQTKDGVRVEIKTKNEKGDESTEVYEAKSAEEFAKKYPEVVQKYGIRFSDDGTFRFQFGPGMNPRGLLRGFPRLDPDSFRLTPPHQLQQRDRLGVLVEPLTKDRAEKLGIDKTRGLVVHQVQPDTLAERLGLKADDVLLTINGKAIDHVPDVKQALTRLRGEDTVKVEVFRPGKGTVKLEARKAPLKAKIL
jgi:hypothetical protein